MTANPRDIVAAALPKSWSDGRRVDLATEIVDALAGEGLLAPDVVWTVSLEDGLLPVETVQAYGLIIALDATGEASEISSDRGLVVLE